jgi:hypothetical protein
MLDWQKGVVTRLKENTQVNWNDIAHAVEENPESLRKFWQRERLIQDLPPKVVLPKKGKITATIGVKLKKKQKEEPKISFRKLAGWIHETEGVKIHHSSIADYFNRNRWMTILMPYKIPLRPMNRAKRLGFAQKYIEDWDSIYRVLWSDETSVTAYPTKREITIRVHQSCKDSDIQFIPKVQQGGFSVMFWGCFSRHAKGPLTVVEGRIDSQKYLELVQEVVMPEIQASGVDLIFMQDNARPHTARVVTDYYHENNVQMLDWPPQSPDLNPIEQIWAIMKEKLYSQKSFPKNRDELITSFFRIWNELPASLLVNLSDSIPERLEKVIKNKGGWF